MPRSLPGVTLLRSVFAAFLLAAGCAAVPHNPDPTPPRHLVLGPIMPGDADDFVSELSAAVEAKEPALDITIDSPGGSVALMFDILDTMRRGQKQGMEITCTVDGMAASAAAVIFEVGCTKRIMKRDAQLMFHEPAVYGTFGGKESEWRKIADALADANRRSAILVAAHLTHPDGTPWIADEYEAWIRDRDRWVDWHEALIMGAVDSVEVM